MARMGDDELRSLIDAEMRMAVGYWSGKLAMQRQRAMYFYLAEPKMELAPPEIEGRSSVVSPDVRNTIESMLPQLMTKFAGSDQPVEFEPTKPGDEEKAEQATDFISYLYNVKNKGEEITYRWMKDALLSKNGILKVWWDKRAEEKREEYLGLTDIELAQIVDDEEIEITEQRSYPDEEDAEQRQEAIQQITAQMQQAQQAAQQGNPQAQQAVMQMQQRIAEIQAKPPAMLWDVTCKRRKEGGRVRVENVPPEEFLISRKAKNIEDAPFVGHRVARTKSELLSMGYKDLDNLGGDDNAVALNMERIERLSYDDELAYLQVEGASGVDDSQRIYWITEAYIRVDYDGDGISELRRVLKCGTRIFENDIVDMAPFVSITPVPMPHKFWGLSIADLAIEAQKANTALLRAQLDNTMLQVNGRYFAVDGQVNLDDLLTSRPGGVVRVKSPDSVGRLDQGLGDTQTSMMMMEYMRSFTEDSTGWSRNSQGNDPSALKNGVTATQANIVTNKADMRVDLIARNFAQGFRDLFSMMLKLVCQYQQREQITNLRGKWVAINPREWRNGFEVRINVGLGTGNRDQQINHLMALLAQQQFGLQVGTATPDNVYNAQAQLAVSMGFKSGDRFFTNPEGKPLQQPPHPEIIKSQTAMQLKQVELQADREKWQAQMQADAQRWQADMQTKLAEGQRAHEARMAEIQQSLAVQATNDQRDAQREMMKAELDAQVRAQEQAHQQWLNDRKLELDKYIADLGAQVKLAIADKAAAPPVDVAPMQATLTALIEHLQSPAEIVRDPKSGRAMGIRRVPVKKTSAPVAPKPESKDGNQT